MICNVLSSVIIGLLILSLVQAQETQGTPGVDYPNFVTVPNSSFKCSDQEFIPGFYADLETQCQVYHYCSEGSQETFLCPIGSIFNQEKLACDAWYNFNCTLAPQSYSSNSGFLLENAMKNVPLLIKLRNRAQNRRSFGVPAANGDEKMTSLYDGAELYRSSPKDSNVFNNIAEQSEDTNDELQGEMLNEDESLDDILSRLEASIQNDETSDEMYHGDGSDENARTSDNFQTDLFFDSVTEQYYTDPETSQNEWSQIFEDDRYDSYDKRNFAYKYGLAMQDADESFSLIESTSEPTEHYRMNRAEAEDNQFLRRQIDLEQRFRRLRRKPIYTVVQDHDVTHVDSEVSFSTESTLGVTDVGSQPSAEITTEDARVPNTMAPFDMVEDISRMHMTPLDVTEVPMTSEEFEDAIISELIVPKLHEHDLRVIGSSSDQEQPTEGYVDGTSSDVQNDGYYEFVENGNSDQYVYDAGHDVESGTGDEMGDDAAEYYKNDDTADGESGKSGDTFVVIPDESEVKEFSEAFDTTESSEYDQQDFSASSLNEDAAAPESVDFNIPNSYEPESVYLSDPSQYHTQFSRSVEYAPGQYFQDGYFNPQHVESSSPEFSAVSYIADETEAMGSQLHPYTVEANDPTNQFMYASPASYACQRQNDYSNCIYGPQTSYPYDGYYDNPYVNFPHGISDMQEPRESPVYIDGSYSSESPMSYMDQGDMYNQLEINPDNEHPSFYQDQNLETSVYGESLPDDTGAVLEDENTDQETYYVLDDDDDDKTPSEVDSKTVLETSLDNEKDVASSVAGNEDETFIILDDEDEGKVMQNDPEFQNISENEEIHKQPSSQDKPIHLEEPSLKNSFDAMPSEGTDSKDVLRSEEKPALGNDNPDSFFVSTMDSRFTHAANDGPFTAETDRHGNVLQDSSEQGRKDETPEVLVPNYGNLPNMFLNNMAYSDPINFGPHGFGSSFGQSMTKGSPTTFSVTNGLKRSGDPAAPKTSKLSALQERMRSLKQGKFGAFKKYVSSSGSKI